MEYKMKQLSLKEAERKAFRMTFQDGIWDIFLGLVILQFAVIPLLTDLGWGDFWSSMVMLPVYLLALWGVRNVKRKFTTPRVGLVNFNPERKSKIGKLTLITTGIMVLGLIFGLLFFVGGDFNEWFFPAVFSIVAMATFGGAAYYLDFPRLQLYGIMTALSPLIGQVLYINLDVMHHGFPITFGLSGISMITAGVYLFLRFLREYPLMDPQSE
jgi:hypothetical protein